MSARNRIAVGSVFGNWTVTSEKPDKKGAKTSYEVKCACGTISVVLGTYLIRGKTSCCVSCNQAAATNANTHKALKLWTTEKKFNKRKCSTCHKVKSLKNYSPDDSGRGYLSRRCKACTRFSHQKAKYKFISVKELRAFRKRNNGICEIAGCEKKATDIDHNHKTGKLRGHLCNSCNVVLRHDMTAEKFLGMAQYLQDNS